MLISSLGFGLVSCSSDDDGGGPNYSVVGKWKVTSYTVNGASMEDCTLNGVRQFKNDGTYLQDDYMEDENGNCTETEDSPLIGTYTKSGDDLTTNLDGLTKVYGIEFISETKFELTETFNNIDFVYTYTKQ